MPEKKITSYPKEKINILFLENISKTAAQKFIDAGYTSVKRVGGAMTESELIKEIKNVHLLGIRSKTKVTKEVLKNASR
jgi:D-3-phosphoglycerate dehydrogenase / 2-oxoglutarate reductase